MTYDELNVYLEDVECQKALLMLEAVNEMDSDVYMESGDGLIKKLINRLKKLFESIKDWFSKHFRRNKVAKGITIRMSKSEVDQINKEHKFAQKLKSGIKNPKNWAILITSAVAIGFGMRSRKLSEKNNKLEVQNSELKDINFKNGIDLKCNATDIDILKKRVAETEEYLRDANKNYEELLERYYDDANNNDKKISDLRKELSEQRLQAQSAESSAETYSDLALKRLKKITELESDNKNLRHAFISANKKKNQFKRDAKKNEITEIANVLEKAGTSNMQHAQKLEAKVEKEKVEDSIKEEPKKIDKTSINADNGTKKVKKYKLQRGKKLGSAYVMDINNLDGDFEGAGIVRRIPKSTEATTHTDKNGNKFIMYNKPIKTTILNKKSISDQKYAANPNKKRIVIGDKDTSYIDPNKGGK